MARSGLATLVRRVRGMTQAGTADFTLVKGSGNAEYWWSDDHIQEVLDTYRTDYQFEQLSAVPETIAGAYIYKNYYLPDHNLEEANSGSVYWLVTDALGNDRGTANYTANYTRGLIRFAANQAGSAIYFTGMAYNLNAVAADIWRQKGANAALYFNFKSDNQSFDRGQFFDHCMSMAQHYDAQAGFTVSVLRRDDLLSGGASPNASLRLSDGGIPAEGWDS